MLSGVLEEYSNTMVYQNMLQSSGVGAWFSFQGQVKVESVGCQPARPCVSSRLVGRWRPSTSVQVTSPRRHAEGVFANSTNPPSGSRYLRDDAFLVSSDLRIFLFGRRWRISPVSAPGGSSGFLSPDQRRGVNFHDGKGSVFVTPGGQFLMTLDTRARSLS